MELRHYINVLLKWWWLILISVVTAGAASYLGTRSMPRAYRSRTTLMVGQALQNPNPSQSEFSTGQVLAFSYADMARREPVLKATLNALSLPWDWAALQGMVSSRIVPGTQLLEIAVQDSDPRRAQILADEIAQQLILQSPAATDKQKEAERRFILSQVQDLRANINKSQDEVRQLDDVIAKATSARQIQEARSRQSALQLQVSTWQATYAQLLSNLQQGAPNYLSVIEPAQTPSQPVGPRMAYNVGLAAVIGLVLACGAAFLLEYLDDTLKTPDDVRRALDLTTLGSIARIEGEDYPDKLVVARQPRSPVAEAYRVLRANLQFSAKDHPLRTLMVTSSTPLEGKSVMAANLAVAMAQSGKRVILVDADLRRPTQHYIFQVDNSIGLADVLQGTIALDVAVQPAEVERLRVLPSGPSPSNPTELLGSKRMGDLIESLQQQADVVIFDSPPVTVAADATILAARLDSTLLVVDSGSTRRGLAQRSIEALEAAGARLPGVALNRLGTRNGDYYYHYYYSEDGQRQRHRSARAPSASLPQPAHRRPSAPDLARPAAIADSRSPLGDKNAPGALPGRLPMHSVLRIGQFSQPLKDTWRRAGWIMEDLQDWLQDQAESARRAVRHEALPLAQRHPRAEPRRAQPFSKVIPLALLGISAGAVALAVFALSLSRQQASKISYEATVTSAAARFAATQTTVAMIIPATQTPVATASQTESVPPTEGLQLQPTTSMGLPTGGLRLQTATPVAPAETAAAAATATQQAINAAAARQAVSFLDCETLDFQVLKSPPDVQAVTANLINTELTWRVRNNAAPPHCKWGQAKQETKLLRALQVGAQQGTGIPVKLKWIQEDEYDLSLTVPLGVGKYTLSWRLILPKTNLIGGPDLQARVNIVAPTRVPATPTLAPTPTVCRIETFQCNCRKECDPRSGCQQVCDVCTRENCD